MSPLGAKGAFYLIAVFLTATNSLVGMEIQQTCALCLSGNNLLIKACDCTSA